MPPVFLYAPEDFHNLCLLVRTLEALGHRECCLFDPQRLIRERYGKVRAREARAVSAGALEKMRWVRIEEPARMLAEYAGRVVATVADPAATSLVEHRFEPSDLVLFGPESRGLPTEIVARSAVSLTIPLVAETQSLNLAVALGVVLFERRRQLGVEGRW